ncbi:MAG: CotH kinase family protein [Paludibacteraceae bacterium]|nr:CotH kinase family protein [Paludibacteraceae bacterium]MBQ8020336.1 CotH kinase family protein [Paludibacteraceae bacterium]MBR6111266.1 CotH kinase family protein [Paludibacteraceae bacterium]MBS7364465.1 CotH kinase family protein [Paludibacteraceae bacterium]MEE0083041.1 CotH kinase family protein [Paludibacteraceae bacterium]
MQKLAFLLVSLTMVISSMRAVNIEELRLLKIPVMVVETVNGEMPTCDFIEAPSGCDGLTSTNQNKVPARMLLVLGPDTLYDSGEYLKDVSGLTIRIRGNTSGYVRPMKPYKLKLQKKADLLSRGDDRFKDKNWVLMNYYYYNPIIANKILDLLDFGWHPECEFVNLILNDDYQGLYILSESIKRNADCRVNVSKNDGFLFENDPYWWNDSVYADASAIDNKYKFTFKYPDPEDISEDQVKFISSLMNDVESSILDGTYPQRIDVNSFAKWLLLHDIIGTYDSGGSNMYLSLYDSLSKVRMVSPWDFDSSLNPENKSSWARIHEDRIFYFPYLLSNANTLFLEEYSHIWNTKKNDIFSEMSQFLSIIKESDIAKDITISRRLTLDRWYETDDERYSSYKVEDEIDKLKNWFDERKTWLDENVVEFNSGAYEITHSPEQ